MQHFLPRWWRFVFLLLLAPAWGLAESTRDHLSVTEIIDRLQSGGHIIYLRHATTNHDAKDWDSGALNDCSKQRNLSLEGREQSRRIGASIRALNIPIGAVQSSPYCRCQETAKLAFGGYQRNMDLQFSIKKDRQESRQLGDKLLQLMRQADLSDSNAVFVGHTSNLRDGLGVWPKPEAVAVVFARDDDAFVLLGMIQAEEWPQPEAKTD